MVALLPCKPDHAERRVQLGSSSVALQMSGCEAGGALYAISHVRVTDDAEREPTKAAWRRATVDTLQVSAVVQTQTLRLAKPTAGQTRATAKPGDGAADTAFNVEKLQGKRPDGTAVQAQLTWLIKGPDIYHVAVYGTKLDEEMSELLFSALRLQ